ncbi:MAG: hypothetical protein AB1635_02400 [Acidobacteriota bacterium]
MPPRTAIVAAAVVAAALVIVELAWTMPLGPGVVQLAVFVWFALPGWLVARRVYRHAVGGRAVALGIGPMLGYVACVFLMLYLWLLGLRSWPLLALPPLVVALLAWMPIDAVGREAELPRLTRRDALAAILLLLLVPLVTLLPFANIGAEVGDGRAYRAYFTADFVWAMTVVEEVSKGDVPPQNPFLANEPLRYYWLSHFLSAAEFRIWNGRLMAEQVLIANSIGTSLLFVGFLFVFVRHFVASTGAVAAAVAAVFLANSYEGVHQIYALWRLHAPFDLLRTLNIDAITRWMLGGMPVDGLHRMLLYQPHHLMGYASGLTALLLLRQVHDIGRAEVALAAGVLLGLSLLFSSFIAIVLGAAVAVVYAIRLVTAADWRGLTVAAVSGALPAAAAYILANGLRYVEGGADLMRFGPNYVALRQWPLALLLSFGPMLILGMGGLVAVVRERRRDVLPVVALVVVSLAAYFLVDVPDMGGVWVGWRAGHLLFVSFTVLTAIGLAWVARGGRLVRTAGLGLAAALCLAATPTVAIDVYNAQDTSNRAEASGFPWTLVLTHPEVEALDWLRANTPPDARVQVEPWCRNPATWGYLPAFAGRRMAAGLPIAMIPLRPYEDASSLVRDGVYRANAQEAWAVAHRMGIDVLLVGPPERRHYDRIEARLDARPDLFPPLFRNASVTLYAVAR